MSAIKTDVYETVTNAIVAMIEAGAGSWKMPWHTSAGTVALDLPHNPISGTRYRGINVPLLWSAAHNNSYDTHAWATYKQWAERGAQVRKGEKATTIVFWKKLELRNGETDDEGNPKQIMMARAYAVFNIAQVDGYSPKTKAEPVADTPEAATQRIDEADAFFTAVGSTVKHGGNRAYYTPAGDFIAMPEFAQFPDPVDYYSTLAHEHTHYTGHKSRCDRLEKIKRFGDEAYAFEELIAELGAAFLCAELGLSNKPRPDHAAYIDGWLRVLKSDHKAIFTAASSAQKALDWLNNAASENTVADIQLAA